MALNLFGYRFASVDGTESTHGWLAGQNRTVNRQPGANGQFLLRVGVQETAGSDENNTTLQWQYRLNGGTWTTIDNSSSLVVRTGTNAVFTNNADCTQRLTGGTGEFRANNNGCTTDGTSGGAALDLAANGCAEALIGIQILNADVSIGDLVEIRVARSDGSDLDQYDQIPALRVAREIMTVGNYDNSLHFTQSASVNKISGTVVEVEATGMSSTDLADDTLTMTMHVWGTTIPGSVDPADYTIPLYGPDVWSGGVTGKDGLPIEPGFGFAQDIPEGVKRVVATFQHNQAGNVGFGVQATIVE